VTPRSTSVNEGEPPPEAPPPQRLDFGPYDAPKSYHASRAFAEMQERAERRAAKKKRSMLLIAGVGVAVLVLLWLGNMLARWFGP
jgi:hypothetical protein